MSKFLIDVTQSQILKYLASKLSRNLVREIECLKEIILNLG